MSEIDKKMSVDKEVVEGRVVRIGDAGDPLLSPYPEMPFIVLREHETERTPQKGDKVRAKVDEKGESVLFGTSQKILQSQEPDDGKKEVLNLRNFEPNTYLKAYRLWSNDAVEFDFVEVEGHLHAKVEGDHGVYDVKVTSDNLLECACGHGVTKGVKGKVCSHKIAVQLAIIEEMGYIIDSRRHECSEET